jgi:hypothetical protein
MDEYKQEYHFLGIALAGVYATTKSKWSSFDVSVTIPDNRLNCYLGDLIENGVVLDKRTCNESDIIFGLFSSPMLDCTLPNASCKRMLGQVESCNDISDLKGFDYVSLDLYLDYWASKGARIGVRQGNQIHWRDGKVQDIPSFELRWMEKELKRYNNVCR